MATGYEVKVDRPGASRGEKVEIPGLGLFTSGTSRVVTKEQADNFRALNARPVVSEESEPGESPVYVQELGPTVLEAFAKTDWVTVTTVELDADGNKVSSKSKGGDK